MTKPVIDDLYEEDELPEEWNARAIETMTYRGQVLAWLSWRMPLKVYVLGFLLGLGACFWILALGVVVAIVSGFLVMWGFYCRTNHQSPWDFMVLQTGAPVPEELRQAAREGRPVPPEHPDAAKEAQT